MSSCGSSGYESGSLDGSRRRELVLFEEEAFSPESYVLGRLRPVEEEEVGQVSINWAWSLSSSFCCKRACMPEWMYHLLFIWI